MTKPKTSLKLTSMNPDKDLKTGELDVVYYMIMSTTKKVKWKQNIKMC